MCLRLVESEIAGKVEMGKFENMQGKFEIGEVEIG